MREKNEGKEEIEEIFDASDEEEVGDGEIVGVQAKKPGILQKKSETDRKTSTKAYHTNADILVPSVGELPPTTLGEAKKSMYWQGYEKAIETEITNLEKNNTWEYIDIRSLERGTNVLRSKFVFDIKRDEKGKFIKYKARLVACGYTQQQGIDFFETYASVLNTKSFRIMLVLYNKNPEMRLEHWDIKQAL